MEYLKLYDCQSNFKIIWNLIFLKNYFYKDNEMSISSSSQLLDMIKLMNESNYWTRDYNCKCNITTSFNKRRFQLSYTKTIIDNSLERLLNILGNDQKINNYLDCIHKNKTYVDASDAIKNIGYKVYRISKSDNITRDNINSLFDKLNNEEKFYFVCNMLVSKKYCHFIINNLYIMKSMELYVTHFIELFRYLISYTWIRFYFEESIKKSWINKNDDFIFNIDTASELPTFPVSMETIKYNPYLPLMISNDKLATSINIGGIKQDINYKYYGKITSLDGFKKRFNVFMTGISTFNIFEGLDFKNVDMGISGSVMAACLQEEHPLMIKTKGKQHNCCLSVFDRDWSRYLSEYYSNADLDIMIKESNSIEFIKKARIIYNQIIKNLVKFNNDIIPSDIIKITTYRTIYIFIDEVFIKEKLCTSELTFDYIISKLKDKMIIDLIVPLFENKINEFYDKMFKNYNQSEIDNIKKIYPELFDKNETKYEIHLKKPKIVENNSFTTENINNSDDEESDIEDNSEIIQENHNYDNKVEGINIAFKVKINANPYLNRELEIFPVFVNDFFGIVSKFHLNCVRSYFDGEQVYLTPSCISAHKTYMNLDYKYFSGSKDPIEIINKYRMRGFGTFLNKNEIDKLIKYSSNVEFWNNLYNIKLNVRSSIKLSLGALDIDHKLFQPRLFNSNTIAL